MIFGVWEYYFILCYEKINNGNFDLPNFISEKGKKLIRKILVFKPKDRPSTEEILLDEWFEDL